MPDGSFMLEERDKISVAASAADLTFLIRSLGLTSKKIRKVLIVGGGSNIAFYLASSLTTVGTSVTLIDLNSDRCEKLAEKYPKANVVNADGSDRRVLDDVGIEEMDAVVTLTNVDEENLIISMYADYVGVPKIVTKINRTEYVGMFSDKNIGRVVSPKQVCTSEIVRYVRAMQNTTGGEVLTLHRIVDGQMEAGISRDANDQAPRTDARGYHPEAEYPDRMHQPDGEGYHSQRRRLHPHRRHGHRGYVCRPDYPGS